MTGYMPPRSPVLMCSSLWHMPDAAILTNTSSVLGGSSWIVSTFQSSPMPQRIAASVSMFTSSGSSPATAGSGPLHQDGSVLLRWSRDGLIVRCRSTDACTDYGGRSGDEDQAAAWCLATYFDVPERKPSTFSAFPEARSPK